MDQKSLLNLLETKRQIDYFFHFLPVRFIKETLLPATNKHGKKLCKLSVEVTIEEFVHILGKLYSTEGYRLPVRRMYWEYDQNGIFPGMIYDKYITRTRYEEVLRYLQLFGSDDEDEQVLSYLNAVNSQFAKAFDPGDTISLGESLVKSFHHDLKGKMKII